MMNVRLVSIRIIAVCLAMKMFYFIGIAFTNFEVLANIIYEASELKSQIIA